MKCVAALILLLGLALSVEAVGVPVYQYPEEWGLWKSQHAKKYVSDLEELERHSVWLSNKEYIDQHNANAELFGFTLAMNHLGDLTDSEFIEKYGTYSKSEKSKDKIHSPFFHSSPLASYPESIDWRTKGAVTSVKNQGDCGASYAFSSVGAIEGAAALARGKLTTLSEQNIIDCSVAYGNHGCQGGNMHNTYMYVLASDGIETSNSYPFQGRQSSCTFNKNNAGARISGSVRIPSGSESDLLAAVATAGPVAVAVDASSKAFRYYQSGIYNLPGCSSTSLSHALLVTGYGTANGYDYWLLKNSWGTNWGMSGYIMMTRNRYNQCGIATDASYPTL